MSVGVRVGNVVPLRRRGLTGAAQVFRAATRRIVTRPERWQDEAWQFYDSLGEYRYGVEWLAETVSRVRLVAATKDDDENRPVPDEDGIGVETVASLAGGSSDQARILETFTVLLTVPGEGYLVGEEIDGEQQWDVYSTEDIRSVGEGTEVIDDERSTNTEQKWRRLEPDSIVARVWRPHKRRRHVADSPSRPALPIMRQLDLINRKIDSVLLSRLASAGLILLPDEVTFPVRPEFEDADDPLIEEWITMARQAIENPGTASAVIPLIMRIAGEYVDKIKHIKFGDDPQQGQDQDLEKRDRAIRRLATTLDLPPEVLLGMGDLNHWSAWQIEESGIKTHIAPIVERIVAELTRVVYRPTLLALGESEQDVKKRLIWYDTTDITLRPDRSEAAVQAYDRAELTGEALRRETGFDEGDAPDEKELRDILLRALARDPSVGIQALHKLLNPDEPLVDETPPEPPPGSTTREPPSEAQMPPEGTPDETQEGRPIPEDNGGPVRAPISGRT